MFGLFRKDDTADAKIRVGFDGKDAESGLQNLQKTIKTVVTAAALAMMVRYTGQLAKLGSEAVRVDKNFRNFATQRNQDNKQMMADMRRATMGMVSDVELQQRAMKAMIAGISFEDMIIAMEYVTRYAMSTGDNVGAKMQTVFTGLARGSAAFMDDVGIMIKGTGDVVGKTIAQMREKMGQFADSEDDAASKAEALNAQIENQKVAIGEDLIPVYTAVIALIQKAAQATGWFTREVGNFWEMAGRFWAGTSRETLRVEKSIEKAKEMKDVYSGMIYLDDLRTEKLTEIEKKEAKIAALQIKLAAAPKAPVLSLERDFATSAMEKAQKELFTTRGQVVLLDLAWQQMYDTVGNPPPKKPGVTTDPDAPKGKADKDAGMPAGFMTEADYQTYLMGLAQQDEQAAVVRVQLWSDAWDRLQEKFAESTDISWQQEQEYSELLKEAADSRTDCFISKELEKREAAKQGFDSMVDSAATMNNALSRLSDAYTSRELRNLEARGLGQEQYGKERARIEANAIERSRTFARMQQAIVLARAISDAAGMAVGAGKDEPGGAGMRIAAMIAAGLAAGVEVTTIEMQNFPTGGLVRGMRRTRQPDNVPVMAGGGEYFVNAQATAANRDVLESINNNTATTATGLSKARGGVTNYNFYSIGTDQMLAVERNNRRRQRTGKLL